MNKHIYHNPYSPIRRQRYLRNKQLSPFHSRSLQHSRQIHKITPDYLDSQIPSAQAISKGRKRQSIKGYKPALVIKEALPFNEKKQRIKKRLIIQEVSNCQYRMNSLSISFNKSKTQPSEPKMYSFSSEKKTSLQGSFEICTPPKQSSKERQEKHTIDDGRSQLIKAILKRFKDQHVPQQTEDCSSPSISSLKLKDRLFVGTNKGKDYENIKFIGKRGCPLNKLSRQYLARREKGQCSFKQEQFASQEEGTHLQISPWHAD